MTRKPLHWLSLVLLLVIASGSRCWRPGDEVLPQMLPPTPSLQQLTDEVNHNTSLVASDWATGRLAVPGAASIPVSLALEQPLRFRLRASTAITGTEVDLGSNDELFWLWAKRQQPPALYFCRHDQFLASSARSILPVEPQWIIEAMGLVRFDPSEMPQGPSPVGANRLQILSVRHGPAGDMMKTTVIDSRSGAVLEQNLYDARRSLLASAITSRHHRDPATGALLPRHIEIKCPGTQLDLQIDLDEMQINSLGPQSVGLWVKPVYPGFPDVNLAQAGPPLIGPGPIPGPSQTVPPPNYGSAANYGGAPPNYGVAPSQAPAGYRTYP